MKLTGFFHSAHGDLYCISRTSDTPAGHLLTHNLNTNGKSHMSEDDVRVQIEKGWLKPSSVESLGSDR